MSPESFVASTLAYVAPSVYLGILVAAYKSNRALPKKFHLFSAIAVFVISLVVNGAKSSLISLGAASGLFILIVLTGLLSRTSIFAISICAMALPIKTWWVFIFAIILAGVASFFRLRRVAGREYVSMIAGETVAALTSGQTVIPGLNKPDLKRLPLPDSNNESESPIGQAMREKVYLPMFLMFAVNFTFVFAAYVNR